MNRRDVAVWFCKVWALTGLINATFVLGLNLLNWMLPSATGTRTLGFGGFGSLPFSLPHLILAGFLWVFAASIGTELAAEGEYGAPIASVKELKPLLLRCVGLALLFSATGSLAVTLLQLGYFHFTPVMRLPPTFTRRYVASAFTYGVLSFIGFGLAFTPRIRVFFRS